MEIDGDEGQYFYVRQSSKLSQNMCICPAPQPTDYDHPMSFYPDTDSIVENGMPSRYELEIFCPIIN